MAPRPGNDWTQFQQFLEDFQEHFQDNCRRTMAESIQTGVHAGVEAAFAAQASHTAPQQHQRHRHNPVFEEHNDDSDAENPFGDDDNIQHHNPNRVQQRRNDDDSRWRSGIKLEIPEFHGGSQPEEILDWFVEIDEYLDFKDVPANKQVPYVTTRFCGQRWN